MNRDEIISAVQNIFRDVFDDENLIISDSTNANDIEDWDSLEQINLVVAIEDLFNIEFDMDDVVNFKNVGDMINIIAKKTE